MIADKDWVIYLSRPAGLLKASLWHDWYTSKKTSGILGFTMHDFLGIEHPKGVLRQYRIKDDFASFRDSIKNIVANDPKRTLELLKKGVELNKRAVKLLNKEITMELNEALDFLIELTICSTIFPFWGYSFFKELKLDDKEILELLEELRKKSIYPRICEEIIVPLSEEQLKIKGFEKPELVELLTYKELRNNDFSKLEEREQARKAGKTFVYQDIDGKETIDWVDDAFEFVQKIENIDTDSEIKGQVAYKGKVQGTARLVVTNDLNIEFNEGDILVSISTSPAIMPLIKKASALVTDEGGVMCHAAIVSRELKKPCIIGTKTATNIIKDGDKIEVDANSGIVKVLK